MEIIYRIPFGTFFEGHDTDGADLDASFDTFCDRLTEWINEEFPDADVYVEAHDPGQLQPYLRVMPEEKHEAVEYLIGVLGYEIWQAGSFWCPTEN